MRVAALPRQVTSSSPAIHTPPTGRSRTRTIIAAHTLGNMTGVRSGLICMIVPVRLVAPQRLPRFVCAGWKCSTLQALAGALRETVIVPLGSDQVSGNARAASARLSITLRSHRRQQPRYFPEAIMLTAAV